MPLYDYRCNDCSITFEALILRREHESMVDCPKCHSKSIEQLPSTFAFKISDKTMYRGDCANPYENFTLEHAPRNPDGSKRVVNSLKELRQQEKEGNFALAIAAMDGSNIDDAPQHETWAGDIRRDYDWKWTPPEDRGDTKGVAAGVVASPAETLVDLPNA